MNLHIYLPTNLPTQKIPTLPACSPSCLFLFSLTVEENNCLIKLLKTTAPNFLSQTFYRSINLISQFTTNFEYKQLEEIYGRELFYNLLRSAPANLKELNGASEYSFSNIYFYFCGGPEAIPAHSLAQSF